MTIVEFLAARLDEQEAAWRGGLNLQTRPDFSRLSEQMLAEVAAMRAILAEYRESEELCLRDHNEAGWSASASALERAVRHLAAAWSDHPDFDPAWAPAGE